MSELQLVKTKTLLQTPIERFLEKISVVENGCWLWTAAISYVGYGVFSIRHKCNYAHRFIYEYYYGEISTTLQIDHLCRNRACCNPLHLEQVTQKENLLRGVGAGAINSKKTHCPQGHPYSKENTWFNKNNWRLCKTCAKESRQKIHGKRNV